MTSIEIVGLVAIILISCFAVVAIIVAVPLFRLLNRVRSMADNLEKSLNPVVEKLDYTITNVNSEIGSINDLTQNISLIVEQLQKVIKLARILVTSPLIKVISTAAGLIGSINKSEKKSEVKDGK
jgi:hypothetical protein